MNTEMITMPRQKLVHHAFTLKNNYRQIDPDELDAFVTGQSTGNFFQSRQYLEFYDSLKGYETVWVGVCDQDRRLVGSVICVINRLLPRFNMDFLTRAIVMGGPVVSDDLDDKEAVADLLIGELVKTVRKKSVYLEFRNLFEVDPYRHLFEKYGLAYNDHLNFIIDSSNRARVEANLNKSKQQQIRKSIAAGATVHVATTLDEVRGFYYHVTQLYTLKVKKPFPKWEFFQRFFEQKEKLGLFIIVKFDNKVIGGMMCPIFDGRIIYDWYVAGEDRVYKNIYPSVMATWGAIDYAVENKIPCYDFLGAGKPKHEYGVREFKAQFGGELKNFGRYAAVLNERKYNFSQWLLMKLGYFK